MAVGSAVKTVRDNLKTQLDARSNLSGVAIFKYAPLESNNKKEFIYLGDANSSMDFSKHSALFMKKILI